MSSSPITGCMSLEVTFFFADSAEGHGPERGVLHNRSKACSREPSARLGPALTQRASEYEFRTFDFDRVGKHMLNVSHALDDDTSVVAAQSGQPPSSRSGLWHRKTTVIAALSIAAILLHLVLRFGFHTTPGTYQIPLLATLALGGLPLLYDLLRKLLKREFGSDLLGGISIMTSVLLGEYLAGSIIVLMLSGGEALESYALRSASSVLAALAKRMPSIAHRKRAADTAGCGAGGDRGGRHPRDLSA